MNDDLLKLLLEYFKIQNANNCAPYHWSFLEQECVEKIIDLLGSEVGGK